MTQANPTRLRLKGVIMCSFQRSEVTNLDLYRQEPHYPGDLKKGEAFLLVSKMGNQVVFIFRDPVFSFGVGFAARRVTDSRRLRLDGGTWSPYMLQNYANEVGLHLVGLKRFETIHDEMLARKREKSSRSHARA